MSYLVVVRARAERDIEAARNRYERIQPGLGDRFLAEVQDAFKILETVPTRNSVYYGKFRRINLPIFPYKIFYVVMATKVQVVRVLHAQRHHPRHLGR